ncbi:nisin-resistance protein [Staphylococcus muscae]|uniref:C-terminal processing peptidase n=1 Tax=Staphylococcus muscae TaxID=1294 RepID=A0A240CBG8_9STAP|nr:S41 family peptidase [Staphylococcus muscae]AVQ33897.1 nisin-resistance protein [Staphylococcus muscae]PNZ04573.1 nisin-resistance protein [Staphylococcus muscae]GGA83447.1 peptidase S41 [Staphylococcus muscae]SNW04586.1 C-terminal processing peptidase [Staphylococcus muscae]
MKKIVWWSIGVVTVLAITVFFLLKTYGPYYNIYVMKPSTKDYVKIAITQMESQGLYAKGEQWERAKEEAYQTTKDAKSYEDTHDALRKALKVAGGKHAFLQTPSEQSDVKDQVAYPTSKKVGTTLVLELPGFMGSEKEAERYAKTLNDALEKHDYERVIVDLQNNDGGDMGPMIAGLSKIIPDGTLMSWVDRKGNSFDATLKKGKVNGGGTPIQVKAGSKDLETPVDVLIGDKTASSGEITALAFKGRSHIQFIGKDTATYTTANTTLTLYDGTQMNITNYKIKDRTGKYYENNPIHPDITSDKALETALSQ